MHNIPYHEKIGGIDMKKVIGIIGAVLLIVVIGVLIWYTISRKQRRNQYVTDKKFKFNT